MQTPDYEHMIHCPCCGAPITGNSCEYCGCVIYDFADIDLNGGPSYIRVNTPYGIFSAKVISTSQSNIEISSDEVGAIGKYGKLTNIVKSKNCKITLVLNCITDGDNLFTIVPKDRPYKTALDDWG